jgi:cytoskeleton protein RodZ
MDSYWDPPARLCLNYAVFPVLLDSSFSAISCFTSISKHPGFVPALVTDRLKATDRGMARGNFGERLKRERELREVTLEEITQATRIGPRFLEALENEEWDRLPGGVFNRGFVRSIAHYLGLDEEGFLAEYDLAHGAHADQQAQKHAQKIEDRIPPTPLWVPVAMVLGTLLLVAAIIFGGIYGWRRFVKHTTPKQAASIAVPAASSSMNANASPLPASNRASLPAASPLATAESPLDLSITTSALTHVRVQADGITVLDEAVRPGENRHFFAKKEFVVSTADSSAVLLELNHEAMPPAGAPGTSGTITLTGKNLRQASGGNTQR